MTESAIESSAATDTTASRPATTGRPTRISAEVLRAFTREIFERCDLPPAEAAVVADCMVEADLTGVDTHGVARLSQYVPALQGRKINPQPQLRIVERGPATALVDGDNGMGHLAMDFAARTAVDLARHAGVGWVGVRGSNHAGAAGIYAAIPVAHGMVGIYGAASSVNHMAIWGGSEPILGTNPIAVALPAGEEASVVLDIATSVSSFGQVRKYLLEGKTLPEGWVVDRTGAPVTDPKAAAHANLLPIGGHKGSGLALAIGLLAGVLNGGAFGRDVKEGGSPSNTGQFILALDVARFVPLDAFKAEMDRHIRDLRGSARLPGVDAIRVPGGERMRKRSERTRDGIPFSAALLAQLDGVAASLGLAPLQARTG